MNDSLFPAPYDADRDRIEGIRAIRGIVIASIVGIGFFVSVIFGTFLGMWIA